MLHKVVAGSRKYVLLTALTLLGLLIFVSTVFAHHPEVSGRAVCNTQTGDYQITWTVENSESAAGRTMTIVSATRGSGYASTVDPSGSTQGTEIVGGTTNGTLTNTVVASWFYASSAPKNVSRSGSVRLAGNCTAVTPVPDWDRSSMVFRSGCTSDCEATATVTAEVCNGGSGNMTGPVPWQLYYAVSGNPKNGSVVASGTIPALNSGQCFTLVQSVTEDGNYMFRAEQRPGHPGQGELFSEGCNVDLQMCEATPEPTPVVTEEPTPVVTEEPTPVVTEEPTPVVTEEPTSVVTEEPTPVVTEEPTPVVTEEPTPVVTEEPTPVVTEEPTPVVTEEPTPVGTEEPTPVGTNQPTPVSTNPPYNPSWACKFESIAQYWYFKNVPGGWTFGSVPYQAQESTNIWIGGDGNAPIGSVFEVYVYDSVGNPADESSYSYLATFMVNANNDCSQNDPGAEPTPRPMPASGSGELPGTGGHDSNTGVLIMIALAGGGVIWFLRRSRATIAS